MKVSIIQMNAGDNRDTNLAQAERLVRAAAERDRPRLVALPELFAFIGGTLERRRATAERVPTGPACDLLGRLARQHGIYLHGGSLIERDGDRFYNTSMVFSPDGEIIAKYRKIHLFDVTTPDAASYRESASVDRGSEIVTYRADDFELGCSICYDLRFGELYLALAGRGAQAMLVPAAFTLQTGKDHWEVLCRARAIETQSYVIAPGQVGSYTIDGETRWCYGHSMIVDPWGTVIASCSDGIGWATAVLDKSYVESTRRLIPVQPNRVLRTAQ